MRNDKGMGANRLGLKTEAIQLEGKRLSGGGGRLGGETFYLPVYAHSTSLENVAFWESRIKMSAQQRSVDGEFYLLKIKLLLLILRRFVLF